MTESVNDKNDLAKQPVESKDAAGEPDVKTTTAEQPKAAESPAPAPSSTETVKRDPTPSISPQSVLLSRSPSPHGRHSTRGGITESRFLPENMEGVAQFIVKLYDLVCDESTAKLITWSEEHNNTAFVVFDPAEFASMVLPQYFKHSNFCSFVRQLNIYGFRKIESKQGYVFQQENFRADQPELLKNIQRRKQAHKRPAQPPHTFAPVAKITTGFGGTLLAADISNTMAPIVPADQTNKLSMLAYQCAALSPDTELSQPPQSGLARDVSALRTEIQHLRQLFQDLDNRVRKIEAVLTAPRIFSATLPTVDASAISVIKVEQPPTTV